MSERRGGLRFDIALPIRLRRAGETEWCVGEVHSLGQRGLFVHMESPFSPDTKIEIELHLNQEPLIVDAIVVWQSHRTDTGVGVQFLNPPATLRAAILEALDAAARSSTSSPDAN